jgi:hypothetical protein
MRADEFPAPVSDPEAEGLPGVADDDSTAWDEVASGRVADGPDPGLLPIDRDDRPLGLDHYGTTAGEALAGEPLDVKLGREVPDTSSDGPGAPVADLDAIDEDAVEDTPPVQVNRDSPVSMYDTGAGRGTVGRLVSPADGDGTGVIAVDAGPAGGGASAEEAALHEVP